MRSVLLREVAEEHLVGGEVRVLVEEVVLGHPHVLEARVVGRLHELELVHQRVVLGLGIVVAAELRRVSLDEDPELHHIPHEVRRLESDTLSDVRGPVQPAPIPGWSGGMRVPTLR